MFSGFTVVYGVLAQHIHPFEAPSNLLLRNGRSQQTVFGALFLFISIDSLKKFEGLDQMMANSSHTEGV